MGNKIKGLFMLLIVLGSVQALDLMSFDEFIAKFNKTYTPEEYQAKKKIFDENVDIVTKKNCSACGITKFFDQTREEFAKRTFTLEQPDHRISFAHQQSAGTSTTITGTTTSTSTTGTTPRLSPRSSLDWRDYGAITSVKAQGLCGCCWSFATIALAESSLILKGLATKTIDLSEQYLLKCTPEGTCDGGYIENAIKKIAMSGAPLQSKYPYKPYTNTPGICQSTPNINITGAKPKSYYDLNDQQIKTLLLYGPVAIAIDSTDWQYYTGGIWKCNPLNDVNHAVLLVGYTDRYWIVKNQWGADWGESGYILVSAARGENCKIGTAVHMLSGGLMGVSIFGMLLMLVGLLM